MIDLQDINFEFGGRYLYKEASWQIKPGERIGLIGKNGTGKSTLLRVLMGEYSISGGNIQKQGGIKIGFLTQDFLDRNLEGSVLEVTMQAFEELLDIEKQMHEITAKMETDYNDKLLERLGDLQHQYEMHDGYTIHNRAAEVLEGLGFKTEQLDKPLQQFSGGWRMRALLAQMLLTKPDLLMLDEPTNHLDLPSIQWLENYLKTYAGSVIVVSHDRYFLNRLCNRIVEISNLKFNIFEGNFDDYIDQKEERMLLQQRQFSNQQQYIKDQEKFINRFRAKASKSVAVQSRVKMLDRLDKIEAPEGDTASVGIRFGMDHAGGKVTLEIEKLHKNFGTLNVFNNAEGQIVRGDKVALIGANGLGKSTLLKIVDGLLPAEGKITLGHNVHMSYFSQQQSESLDNTKTIVDELQYFAPWVKEQDARTILGSFLFTGEDVFKKIKVLSGGEKSRVALAKTVVSRSNFLLLDEPTNHLDMQSVNILAKALIEYEGSILLVSHDRHFINMIADKIWFIENQKIKEYPGGYEEFEEWYNKRVVPPPTVAKQLHKDEKPAQVAGEKNDPAQKQVSKNKLIQMQKDMDKLEQEIELHKQQLKKIEDSYNNPDIASDSKKLNEATGEHKKLSDTIKQLNLNFETLFEQMMLLQEN